MCPVHLCDVQQRVIAVLVNAAEVVVAVQWRHHLKNVSIPERVKSDGYHVANQGNKQNTAEEV